MKQNRSYPYLVTIVIMAVFFGLTKFLIPMFDPGDFSPQTLGLTTLIVTLIQLSLTVIIVVIMRRDGSYPVLRQPGYRLAELFKPILGWVFIIIKAGSVLLLVNLAPAELIKVQPLGVVLALVFSFSIGFFEEYLFRGFLFKNLMKERDESHAMSAALISSFLFGLFHIDFLMVSRGVSIGQFAVAFFAMGVGFYLAAVTYRFGKMWIPVTIHALIDFPTFLLVALVDTERIFDLLEPFLNDMPLSVTDMGMGEGNIAVAAIGLVFLFAGYRMLNKTISARRQARLFEEEIRRQMLESYGSDYLPNPEHYTLSGFSDESDEPDSQ